MMKLKGRETRHTTVARGVREPGTLNVIVPRCPFCEGRHVHNDQGRTIAGCSPAGRAPLEYIVVLVNAHVETHRRDMLHTVGRCAKFDWGMF